MLALNHVSMTAKIEIPFFYLKVKVHLDNTMDLPYDVLSHIISQADLPIDTHISLGKHRKLHVVRRRPVQIQDDVKNKLDMLCKRRWRKYNARKTHSFSSWVALDDISMHIDNDTKLVEIIIDDLGDDIIRMCFKLSNIDHDNQEISTIHETCVDVNTGEACEKWIYV